ncbi:MAG: GNAT family N-acetyltransferase [Betaproteobacteria bacterium]|nr:GNAT family N-acetyltransferase [Betaproteobacteria bacterium]
MLKIEPLSPTTLPALARFSAQTWSRPDSPAYLDWRYGDAHRATTWVAYHNPEEILATVSGFHAHYQWSHGQTSGQADVLETCDWYCRPDLRGSGLGIRVMTTLIKQGKRPVVALGGSADTLSLLPRMGFKQLGTGCKFILPLSAKLARHVSSNRLAVTGLSLGLSVALPAYRLVQAALNGFAARSRYVIGDDLGEWVSGSNELSINGTTLPLSPAPSPSRGRGESQPLPTTIPLPPSGGGPGRGGSGPEHAQFSAKVALSSRCNNDFRWLQQGADWVGRVVSASPLDAGNDGPTVILRLYRHSKGSLIAKVLEVFAKPGSTFHLAAVLQSVGAALRQQGVAALMVNTTDPKRASQLQGAGFIPTSTSPLLVWADNIDLTGIHLMGMRGDDGYLPLHIPS